MFKSLIKKIALSFSEEDIPYMIIGGQAVLLYGEPRLTRDIDVTLGVGKEKLPEIIRVIGNLSLQPLSDDIEAFVEKTMVLPAIEEGSKIRVDLIFSYTPYEKIAVARAKKVEIDGITVSFAAIEDLIIHKIFAGRPRDIEDVKSVILKNRTFDMLYIKKWLIEFDASLPEGGLVEAFESIIEETR